MHLLPYSLLALWLSLVQVVYSAVGYDEQLILQPLPSSSLLASFNFRSNATQTSFQQHHFSYFPRSLGQILEHTKTRELHLRFSSGRWDAESWGAKPWEGAKEGGTGVEIWAWLEAETPDEAFARWITLNHALSGLFCASMNFIDSTKTIRPVMTFKPQGDHHENDMPYLHLLHGTLPHEVVCTENLTPFLKLLPCKGKAGIASLLDGHKLFDASWQSMSIDVQPLCPADSWDCVVAMDQTVDMVLDIERSKRPRDNPIPRPIPRDELQCDTSKPYHLMNDACFPVEPAYHRPWSLTEIFGRPIKGTCLSKQIGPVESRPVCLTVPHDRTVFSSTGVIEHKLESANYRCFTLNETADFELILPEQNDLQARVELTQPPLYAERSFTGHGQERGGVQALLTNPSSTSAVEFIYLESLPWFMRPYIHTLKARIAGRSSNEEVVKDIYYRPAVDRYRGTHLELRMIVPPASRVSLSYSFEKAILRYTEYPPDANRGFDVPPAVIRLLPSNDTTEGLSRTTYLRTTSLLLPLPTPDFSMPYNVIILTSTVMALAFGFIFNLLVRRFVSAEEAGATGLAKLKVRLVEGVTKIRTRILAVLKGRDKDREKKDQ
ncbi:Subunit of the glycosylphosphatidylinositol transamidase complex-like protein [Agyrium rufum]|nr:Subunit of the glycosylphosphatidylinositol transamidase complex-like protein [Agyrium rufum]